MNPRLSLTLLLTGALLTTAAACTVENPVFDPDPLPPGASCAEGRETVQDIPSFEDPGSLDILIVVSDAPGTASLQQRLAAAMPRFVDQLTDSGIDFQIGVISGDTRNPDLTGSLRAGEGDGCDGTRLIKGDDPEAAARQAACNVLLGEGGNTVQEMLEAAKTALTSRNNQPLDDGGNAGFLRPRSRLMLLLATDRDDCSNDNFDFSGLDAPNAVTACAQVEDDLTSIETLAQDIMALRDNPEAVSVALLGGSDDGRDLEPGQRLEPTCLDSEGSPVFPTTRLLEFAGLFAPKTLFEPACASSFGQSISNINTLASPTNLILCPGIELTDAPLSVSLGDEELEQGTEGFVYLGATDACPTGAIEINAQKLLNNTDTALSVRFCAE